MNSLPLNSRFDHSSCTVCSWYVSQDTVSISHVANGRQNIFAPGVVGIWKGSGKEVIRRPVAAGGSEYGDQIFREGDWSEAGRGVEREGERVCLQVDGVREDEVVFDSSVKTLYGEQEGAKRGYNPRKPGRPSHHPLFCFLRESAYSVNLWNRSGNVHSGQGVVEFAKEIMGALCDTGFYQSRWVRWLEGEGQRYIIAVPLWWPIQEAVMEVSQFEEISEGIEVGEFWFEHKAEGWEKLKMRLRRAEALRGGASGPRQEASS
jgi:hypothetical protein